jgi:hypothetical protein
VEERRSARVGTVSGLALLAGGTAIAAVAGGAHSAFATALLGVLTMGLGHSLIVEIKRQARRRSAAGWHRYDTVNAVLLGLWAETALAGGLLLDGSGQVRAVGVALALAYALACGYFVVERRRAIADLARSAPFVASVAEQNQEARTTLGGEDDDHRGHRYALRLDRELWRG